MIHPTALIDAAASIGANVSIGPFTIIGAGVEIGDGTQIGSHCVIKGPTRIGKDNRIHAHASLGGDPQDKKFAGERTELVVGDRNTIFEFTTISRGTGDGGGITRIGTTTGTWRMCTSRTIARLEAISSSPTTPPLPAMPWSRTGRSSAASPAFTSSAGSAPTL